VLEGQPPGEDRTRFDLIEDGTQQLLVGLSAQQLNRPDRLRDLDVMPAGRQWPSAG